jgi:hypothetical protein
MKKTVNSTRGFVFHAISPSSKAKENAGQVILPRGSEWVNILLVIFAGSFSLIADKIFQLIGDKR